MQESIFSLETHREQSICLSLSKQRVTETLLCDKKTGWLCRFREAEKNGDWAGSKSEYSCNVGDLVFVH